MSYKVLLTNISPCMVLMQRELACITYFLSNSFIFSAMSCLLQKTFCLKSSTISLPVSINGWQYNIITSGLDLEGEESSAFWMEPEQWIFCNGLNTSVCWFAVLEIMIFDCQYVPCTKKRLLLKGWLSFS